MVLLFLDVHFLHYIHVRSASKRNTISSIQRKCVGLWSHYKHIVNLHFESVPTFFIRLYLKKKKTTNKSETPFMVLQVFFIQSLIIIAKTNQNQNLGKTYTCKTIFFLIINTWSFQFHILLQCPLILSVLMDATADANRGQ